MGDIVRYVVWNVAWVKVRMLNGILEWFTEFLLLNTFQILLYHLQVHYVVLGKGMILKGALRMLSAYIIGKIITELFIEYPRFDPLLDF